MAGFLLVLLLAIVGAAGSASAESVQLKLMTYNVKAPGWNPDRRAQVVGAIEAEAPDVLALQEAAPASSGPELETDLSAAYEPHMTGTENPIYLLRAQSFLVLEQGVEDLPTCTEVPVGNAVLTWVRIETPEGLRSTIYNTHLCLSMHPIFGGDPEGNQAQAVATVEFMEANGEVGRPDFLAGDLNADSNTPTVLFLLEQEPVEIGGTSFSNPILLDDTWASAPANAGQPKPGTTASGSGFSLDWIMAVPEVEVVAAEVIEFTIPPGEGDGYSDHFPVTATVQLDGSAVAVPALSWPGAAVLVGLLVWQMRRSGQRSR